MIFLIYSRFASALTCPVLPGIITDYLKLSGVYMQRLLRLALGFLFLLLLPACIDYEVKLTLNSNGSGQIICTLDAPASRQIDWEEPLARRIFSPEPACIQPLLSNGRLRLAEQADFKLLGDLELDGLRFSLSIVDHGFLGITDYTYKLTTMLISTENINLPGLGLAGFEASPPPVKPWPQDETIPQALALRAAACGEHAITIIHDLPGRITSADNIALGDYVAIPRIEGNRVSWEIPLAQLIAHDIRNNLRFSCSFTSAYQPSPRLTRAWSTRLYSGAAIDSPTASGKNEP